jgi:hypothetical protein
MRYNTLHPLLSSNSITSLTKSGIKETAFTYIVPQATIFMAYECELLNWIQKLHLACFKRVATNYIVDECLAQKPMHMPFLILFNIYYNVIRKERSTNNYSFSLIQQFVTNRDVVLVFYDTNLFPKDSTGRFVQRIVQIAENGNFFVLRWCCLK